MPEVKAPVGISKREMKQQQNEEPMKPKTRQWGSVNVRDQSWRHSSSGAQAFPALGEGAYLLVAWRLTRTSLWMIKRDEMK